MYDRRIDCASGYISMASGSGTCEGVFDDKKLCDPFNGAARFRSSSLQPWQKISVHPTDAKARTHLPSSGSSSSSSFRFLRDELTTRVGFEATCIPALYIDSYSCV